MLQNFTQIWSLAGPTCCRHLHQHFIRLWMTETGQRLVGMHFSSCKLIHANPLFFALKINVFILLAKADSFIQDWWLTLCKMGQKSNVHGQLAFKQLQPVQWHMLRLWLGDERPLLHSWLNKPRCFFLGQSWPLLCTGPSCWIWIVSSQDP